MSFILGQSDSISRRAFKKLKYLLSALSVTVTSGFVMLLHSHA
jgi:hypothetical protein